MTIKYPNHCCSQWVRPRWEWVVGESKPSPEKVVFVGLRSTFSPAFRQFKEDFLTVTPGDCLLEGGEVGEASLVGSQPIWDVWQGLEIIHLVPGHVEKPPKVREGFRDRELHKQTENNPHGWRCHWYIKIVSQEDDMFTILIIVTNLLVWVTNITWWTGAYSQPGFPASQDPDPRVSRLKSLRSPPPASVWCDRC